MAASIAAAFTVVSGAAFADDNLADIMQQGNLNTADQQQDGNANVADIEQIGSGAAASFNNTAEQDQVGDSNDASIQQIVMRLAFLTGANHLLQYGHAIANG